MILAAAAQAALGCTTGMFPRPAEVARPGKATFMIHGVYAGIAPASAVVVGGSGVGGTDSEDAEGNGASPRGRQGSMFVWGPLAGVEGRLAFGMFEPCEGAVLLGISRLATEVRCGVAAGDGGGPAVSVSGAAGYEPFFSRDGWWGRAAVDVSTPRAPWRLVFGAALTYGPEAYSVASTADEDFSLPDDAWEPYAQLRRKELRVSLAGGVAWSGPSGQDMEIDGISFRGYRGTTYIMGLVPHVTLSSWDERVACVGCNGTIEDFDVMFGVSVVLGVGWFDPEGIPSPFAPERSSLE